jgi:hypothetical protein
MKKYTSWNTISKNKSIEFVQDPILNMELFKKDFEETYEKILNTLIADNDYLDTSIEYFFELHPLRKNVLVFRNDEKKSEFYDIGIELDCVEPLKNIKEGTQNE